MQVNSEVRHPGRVETLSYSQALDPLFGCPLVDSTEDLSFVKEAGIDPISWKNFPIIIRKEEKELLHSGHLICLLQGHLLVPSQAVKLNESSLCQTAQLIDDEFHRAMQMYRKTLAEAYAKDSVTIQQIHSLRETSSLWLSVKALVKQQSPVQSEALYQRFLKHRGSHFRVIWLKEVNAREKIRLEHAQSVIGSRVKVVSSDLEKQKSKNLIDKSIENEKQQLNDLYAYLHLQVQPLLTSPLPSLPLSLPHLVSLSSPELDAKIDLNLSSSLPKSKETPSFDAQASSPQSKKTKDSSATNKGKEHGKVTPVLPSQGRTWQKEGKKEEALSYYEKSLSLLRKNYVKNNDKDHVEMLIILYQLGDLLKSLKRYQEALVYYEELLKHYQDLYDEDDKEMIELKKIMTQLRQDSIPPLEPKLEAKGHLPVPSTTPKLEPLAKPLPSSHLNKDSREMLEIKNRVHPLPQSFTSASESQQTIKGDLSASSIKPKIVPTAEPSSSIPLTPLANPSPMAVKIAAMLSPKLEPRPVPSKKDQGDHYLERKEIQKAIEVYTQALEEANEQNKPLYVLNKITNLIKKAIFLLPQQKSEEMINDLIAINKRCCQVIGEASPDAIKQYMKVIDNPSKKERGKDPIIALNFSKLSRAYYGLKDYQKAKEYLIKALKMSQEIYGTEHFDVALILTNLGQACHNLGEYQKAVEYYEKALGIWEKNVDEEPRNLAIHLWSLSITYYSLGKQQQALELLERALKIMEKLYGVQHLYVGRILREMSTIRLRIGDKQKAKEDEEKALEIYKNVYGEHQAMVAIELCKLGANWIEIIEALRDFEQLLKTYQECYGDKEAPEMVKKHILANLVKHFSNW